MKRLNLLLLVCAWLLSNGLYAQTLSDEGRISLNAVVPEGDIPAESCRYLETKLTRAIAANGFADNGYADRFVLTAKVDITSKDVVSSAPPRVSQQMDVTFMVGDVVENKVYTTCTVALAGIGTNETKAFISAFSKVNPNNKELQAMLAEAKAKIVSFYSAHCDEIIQASRTLAGMQKYDEAIFRLTSVPNVNADCYERCQKTAVNIYREKIDTECVILLNQAKIVWMKQPDATGAEEVAAIIARISPKAKKYSEVASFRDEISKKLKADAKREWEFEMQQYEDSQVFKQSIVDACKAVGVAFGNGLPKSVAKTIVKKW